MMTFEGVYTNKCLLSVGVVKCSMKPLRSVGLTSILKSS